MEQEHLTYGGGVSPPALPRHYTVAEIAESLQLSPDTIRTMFQDRPGVLRITKGRRLRGKREYVTLRVPADVLADFLQELRAA
jgi:hypothetical protein